MHRLGPCSSNSSDWGATTGYYSRLTIAPNSELCRNLNRYPPIPSASGTRGFLPVTMQDPRRMFRTECLDLGHVQTTYELSKSYSKINSYLNFPPLILFSLSRTLTT